MAKIVKPGRAIRKSEPVLDSRRHEFLGILLLALAFLCIASLYLAPVNDLTPPTTGVIGNLLAQILTGLAGVARYLLAVLIGTWGLAMIMQRRWPVIGRRMLFFLALFLCVLSLLHIQIIPGDDYWQTSLQGEGGGIIGAILAWALVGVVGVLGSYIVLGSIIIVSFLSITNLSLVELLRGFVKFVNNAWEKFKESIDNFLYVTIDEEEVIEIGKKNQSSKDNLEGKIDFSNKFKLKNSEPRCETVDSAGIIKVAGNSQTIGKEIDLEFAREQAAASIPIRVPSCEIDNHAQMEREAGSAFGLEFESEEEVVFPLPEGFILPPLNLLRPITKPKVHQLNKNIQENTRILEETLENFGVKVRVAEVSQGPAITRYELHPAPGIKVSKIMGLADDIALSMAAQQVRIEAPIPGKSAIGIEIPNQEISLVHLREVLESKDFLESASRLSVAFGKDIAGRPVVGDLTKMPHLLIAGATGMGTSVCLNSLICSILFKSNPQEVKFLMIDPKMVELTTYNGIPHLITPVVTNPKKAAVALRWAVTQMEQRYEKFAAVGAKDVIRYNKAKLKENRLDEVLPYMVIIIDELADLMMIAPADVEDAVCRLAQMARAAGMHLVLATQRPSVDVITGLIKANIPSRIAFAVSSQMDSRTILDVGGAEKLVGRGDMLYMPVGFAKPIRVQGPYISDEEVDKLVSFLKRQEKPLFVEGITEGENKAAPESEEEDELFLDAVRLFIESGQASISSLQRRFRIGYTRAARLIDMMERRGVIGPFEGSKPREVLMTIEQYENRYGHF
jgi:S-DNA-T family DNA segregation ATPase FtsK/SpoIIIE